MSSEDAEASAAVQRQWDVIVIGTGSGGKVAAQEFARRGRSVLAVEAHRFGGECPYVACVPAKSMLAAARVGLSWPDAVRQRDDITDNRDDAVGRKSLDHSGVTTLRGRATLAGPSEVEVADVVHTAPVIVVATGSTPKIPPLPGLDGLDYWTSDVALSVHDQPESLVILGGGAVGCELAQAFALLGTTVHLVEIADHLLPAEASWAGEALAARLREDGIKIYLGQEPVRAGRSDGGCMVELADGTAVRAERVLVAGGREPCLEGLGLDDVTVDARCRVVGPDGTPVGGLYAVGDVTGVSTYTHSANYQAKIAAADASGQGRDANYSAVPRVVYTDPAVFAVGESTADGPHTRTAHIALDDVERALILRHACPPGRNARYKAASS
ncbi:dihydrolipoyl dehydrogenase family protein [Mangrovihabitans endophyticus]|uniref:Pyridine nucleotide-disulfide oxidoreductase n=1 Tax=Mangrovihabitans endophyticus TaxID=1751298 RepID=A0A8J3C336_9ACTN|nr:NAD(P)/FAD-dependent oxidoreductase [Mangrovihabitans endophyticus]GGL11656.1 pyridine nucleotide-disulfide oxidoreductase [Mangrovihabitans endophyticus]